MKTIGLFLLAALVVCAGVSSTASASTLAYYDTFESYTNGQLINGQNGWFAPPLVRATTAQAYAGSKSCVVPFSGGMTNDFTGAANTNVWLQFYARIPLTQSGIGEGANPPPEVTLFATDDDRSAQFYINSNGYPVVEHSSGATTSWVVRTTTVGGGAVSALSGDTWNRFTLNVVYGSNVWHLFMNDVLIAEHLRLLRQNIPASLERLSITSTHTNAPTYVDNVLVTSDSVAAVPWGPLGPGNYGVGLTGDGDGDGMNDAWELYFFGETYSTQGPDDDPDGDDATNQEESLGNTDPLDPASAPTHYALPYTDNFERRSRTTINGQHGWSTPVPANMEVQGSTVFAGSNTLSVGTGWLQMTNLHVSAYTNVWLEFVMQSHSNIYVITDPWQEPSGTPEGGEFYPMGSAWFRVEANNVIRASDGGQNFEVNQYLGGAITNAIDHAPGAWYRYVVHLDYVSDTWELYLTTNALAPQSYAWPIAYELDFTNNMSLFQGFGLTNTSVAAAFLDDVSITYNATPGSIDYDGDGIPDQWEEQYGQQRDIGTATADHDADGWNGMQEWVMNTSLYGSNTFVRITSVDLASETSDDVVITVQTGPDRSYAIYASDASDGTQTQLAAFTTGPSQTQYTYTETNAMAHSAQRFYTLRTMFNGMVVTNLERFAAYRQDRSAEDQWYWVGIPIDYGSSNALTSTLGRHLARGLYPGGAVAGDRLHVMTNSSRYATFYLATDTNWYVVGVGTPALLSVPAGRAVLIERLATAGFRETAVFCGPTHMLEVATNAAAYPYITRAYTGTVVNVGWNQLCWPYDRPSDEWEFAASGAHSVPNLLDTDTLWRVRDGHAARFRLTTGGDWLGRNGQPAPPNTLLPGELLYYQNKGAGEFKWRPGTF